MKALCLFIEHIISVRLKRELSNQLIRTLADSSLNCMYTMLRLCFHALVEVEKLESRMQFQVSITKSIEKNIYNSDPYCNTGSLICMF